MTSEPLVLDSITKLPPHSENRVAYCASHAGKFCAELALEKRLRAVILHDAGVGLDQAGIAALKCLDLEHVPAAAIDHRSARIGDGADGYRRGRVSYVNASAARLGVNIGSACEDALAILSQKAGARPPRLEPGPKPNEHRTILAHSAGIRIVLADSASLLDEQDAGQIVICGSHGGLLGGHPDSAVRVNVGAILFNDANFGMDEAGISRLPTLDQRGIPAGCVSTWTAHIGNGQSSYSTGVVSALNACALRKGARLGITARQFAEIMSSALMPGK